MLIIINKIKKKKKRKREIIDKKYVIRDFSQALLKSTHVYCTKAEAAYDDSREVSTQTYQDVGIRSH